MDPQTIAQALASGDKEQIKEAQRQLQALGFYSGAIDGSLGRNPSQSGTMRAAQAYTQAEAARAEQQRAEADRQAELDRIKAQSEAESSAAAARQQNAEASEAERITQARDERNRQARTPAGIATQIGANVASPIVGTAAGMGLGAGTNRLLDAAQESRNKVLQGVAADRMAGVTTREGAREAARLSGAVPMNNAALRTTARMLPHLGLGALSVGKGMQVLSQEDPDGPFYPEMANRAAGLGYIGAGAGLAKQGLRYGAAPGVAPDAQALAVINSNQLRRNSQLGNAANRGQIIDAEVVPDAPPQQRALAAPEGASPQPGSKAYYTQEAKRLGIKGHTRMNKAKLIEKINEANQANAGRRVRTPKKLPAMFGPAAAAGLAYYATPSDAQAGTGESVTGQDEALTNAGIAGVVAMGANRLLQALPRAMPAVNAAGTALGMYDYANQANEARQAMPEGIESDMISQAVPLASRIASDVASWQALPGQIQDFIARNQSDPMGGMSNEVQAMPEQAAPEPEDFDTQMADLDRLLQEMDAEGAASPQRAVRSERVASMPVMAPFEQNRLLMAR